MNMPMLDREPIRSVFDDMQFDPAKVLEVARASAATPKTNTASVPAGESDSDLPATVLALAAEGDAAKFWRDLKGETLDGLRALQQSDPQEYLALRSEVKAINRAVSVTDLDKMLRLINGGSESAATVLTKLATTRCELWRDENGEAFASFSGERGERQHWRIDTTGYRDWLSHLAFVETNSAPASETLRAVITALSGRAKFHGEVLEPARRVARNADGYWLAFGDAKWRGILITSTGWRIVDDPPIPFLRNKTTRAYPEPVRGGDPTALWRILNIPENARLLVLTWILECWRSDTPYPVPELSGEQGSSKSTTQKILRTFIDPNEVSLRGRPKTVEDLFVAANNAHLLSFENLSGLSADLSDAACAISTGAGYAARQLYTNGEEVAIRAHAPIILNGITPVITRPDLLDRAIAVHLPRLKHRRTEESLRREVDALAPTIFGGLLDLFVAALARLPEIKNETLPWPRMADFAQLGEAVARSMGHTAGAFIKLYADNRRDAIRRTIDSSPAAMAILKLIDDEGSFGGTVGRLLEVLEKYRPAHESADFWPKSARGLGDVLRRYSPALAVLGIRAEIESRPMRDGFHCEVCKASEHISTLAFAGANDIHNVHNVHSPAQNVNVVNDVNVLSPLQGRGDIYAQPPANVRANFTEIEL